MEHSSSQELFGLPVWQLVVLCLAAVLLAHVIWPWLRIALSPFAEMFEHIRNFCKLYPGVMTAVAVVLLLAYFLPDVR